MKKRFTVWFDIEPKLEVSNRETYHSLGITPEYKNEKLVGVQVDVQAGLDDTHETVKATAVSRITDLIERLRYVTETHLTAVITRIKQTSPEIAKDEQYITIQGILLPAKPFPMPKETDLRTQDRDTTEQLMVYNRGTSAGDASEKIRNFFLALEKEVDMNTQYAIPDDFRYLRHAVSHYKLDREKAKSFLMQRIGSDSVDYNNTFHMRFLLSMLPKLREEAKKLLDSRVH